MIYRRVTHLLVLLSIVGCTDGNSTLTDAASADASPTLDASASDSGAAEAGPPTDAAAADGGAGPDAGPVDGAASMDAGSPPVSTGRPTRGGTFFGDPERFNRHYTDPNYQAASKIYVSPAGTGTGTLSDPTSPGAAIAVATAGQTIHFLAGQYAGCWGLDADHSGTYEAPIVLEAARDPDGSRAVQIDCCDTGRRSCFNLEGANYVAIDGFILQGGRYGVRAVGLGYGGSEHQVGVAIINNLGFDQDNDPFFTGQSDWIAVEGNVAHGAGSGDGHGIYLSNGSDWMVVRGNDLYDNVSSDFQINADPASTCQDVGIDYDDPRCDGSARDGLGQGVSEFVLVENNYFHNGASQGPNFTSVRNSVVRNNIIGPHARHGTSFWQETDNPRLGSSDNVVHHNLFIGEQANRHVLNFTQYSDRNDVRNNIILGLSIQTNSAEANPDVLLLEVDSLTTSANTFFGNYYSGGYFEGHTPTRAEFLNSAFDPAWFVGFPFDRMGSPGSFLPSATAPFLDAAPRTAQTPHDRVGTARADPADLGPYELPGD